MDSGFDGSRRGWLKKGLAALGVIGAGGGAAAVAASQPGEQTSKAEQSLFNPVEGDVVRLQPGRGLKSEVLSRYPQEQDVVTAVRKLGIASGAGDQQNVDQFLPKEAPSKWKGEYIGVREGAQIPGLAGFKVQEVNPDRKVVTLEVSKNGKVSPLVISVDFSNPQKRPDSFSDQEGNSYTFVAALGRKREEIKGIAAPDAVQIPDRVVVYKEKTNPAPTPSNR